MLTKDQFLTMLDGEFAIIRHLAGKLSEADMDYRPSEKQRSVRELLQYMSMIFVATAETLATGDATTFQRYAELSTEVTLGNFDEHMASQAAKLRELVTAMTEAQLAEEVMIWGKMSRAIYLVNLIKFAAAYKTQLFTYMKQNGHTTLNTMNLWAGKDGEMGA